MAAAPAAPPHPAAPLGGRDPRPSARPHGRRRDDPGAFCPRAGLDSSAAAGKAGRARQGSGALRPPQPAGPGSLAGGCPFPAGGRPRTGGGALPPDSSGFHLLLLYWGARSLFAPLFVLLALYSRCSMGLKEKGEVVPLEPVRDDGRAAAGAGSSPRPPEPGSSRGRCRCYRSALPRRGEKLSRAVGVTPLSPASTPVSAGTPGWLLAATRAAARLLGLLVLLSLSLHSPVLLCLSTTFRPAHYNAGERRSQDKDLKGWWVEKQGSKGPSPSRVFRTKPQFRATSQSRPASQV
ncbi:uncharacterized protein LOC127476521 [Manacus candei]|uniref:uncharacterized protein LOC127476521 n=1 Tax=Manacus candei TaxID=415023 RepID=UPI002227FABD|nr:uncharacterized protein LOC127476521 [Manacus candei]